MTRSLRISIPLLFAAVLMAGGVAMANQEVQFTVDILAYCRTLPVK